MNAVAPLLVHHLLNRLALDCLYKRPGLIILGLVPIGERSHVQCPL